MSDLTEMSFICGGDILTSAELLKRGSPIKKVRAASGVEKFKGFIVTGVSEEQISEFIHLRQSRLKTNDALSPAEVRSLAIRQCRGKRLHKPFNIPQAAQEFAAMATKEGYLNVMVSKPESEINSNHL